MYIRTPWRPQCIADDYGLQQGLDALIAMSNGAPVTGNRRPRPVLRLKARPLLYLYRIDEDLSKATIVSKVTMYGSLGMATGRGSRMVSSLHALASTPV